MSKMVVLPAPLGPKRPTISPDLTSTEIPFTTFRPRNPLTKPLALKQATSGTSLPTRLGAASGSTASLTDCLPHPARCEHGNLLLLLIRRPPKSTLFAYPTLFRSVR